MAKSEYFIRDKNKPDHKLVEFYFSKYAGNYDTQADRIIYWICIPLFLFAVLGLAWAIPFPYLKFLGQYNGFFNWASFVIAFCIYYYYKLSPILSYAVLIILFSFSYGVMQLDTWHKTGGPALWFISAILLVLSIFGILSSLKVNHRRPSVVETLRFLILSPIWLLHFVFRKY